MLVAISAGILRGVSSPHQAVPGKPDRFESLLQRGFELHRERQYSRSIPLLEQARLLRRRDYSVNLLLGIDYLRSDNPTKALAFLLDARQARPGDPTALGYLAEVYASQQRFDQAADALQLAASNPKATVQSRVDLLQFYLRRFRTIAEELRSTQVGLAYAYRLQALDLHARGDPKEHEVLLRVQSLAPAFAGLESALGLVELSQREFEQAETAFSRARLRNPDDLDVMVGEAHLAVHSDDLVKAESILAEVASRSRHRLLVALREWSTSEPLPADLRRKLTEMSHSKQAEQALSNPAELFQQQRWERLVEALASRAWSPQESFWLACAYARLDRYEEAIPPLERAWQDPRLRLDSNYWLSLCYARRAEKVVQRLPEWGPEGSLVHSVRGEVLLQLAGNGAGAVAEFRKAVTANPRDPSLWTGLAAAQLLTGDSTGARDSARKALNLDSNRIPALRTLAEASMEERDYAAAVGPLRQVLEAQPDDIGAQVLLGTAYCKTGDDHSALRLLEGALDKGYPDEKGTVHYLFGTVLRRQGREKEAERAFSQAQALSDSFAESTHGSKDASRANEKTTGDKGNRAK